MHNVQGTPPPEDTPRDEAVDSQMQDLVTTPDPTKTNAYTKLVVVENVGGTLYSKEPGVFNNQCMYEND